MERIIEIPDEVQIELDNFKIKVTGSKGTLEKDFYSPLFRKVITIKKKDNKILMSSESERKKVKAMLGTIEAHINNMIKGVTQGYVKELEIVGVGYRAKLDKNKLELSVGYSKPIIYKIPEDIEIILEKPTLITVKGIDKQRVGQVSQEIKNFRKPDPYKLKGIRFVGERLHKKERKAGVSGV